MISPELAASIFSLATETGRQVGVLLDRRGTVEAVIIGDSTSLEIPDLGRARAATRRLRGGRLVHTHLRHEELTRDDLTDLSKLRLDLIAVVLQPADSQPLSIQAAYLIPQNTQGDLWKKLPITPLGTFTLDFQTLITELEGEFAGANTTQKAESEEGAILVHVSSGPRSRADTSLDELAELARTAGVAVLGREVQIRPIPDPKSLIGKGRLEEICLSALQLGADILIFDCDLSPGQIRMIGTETDLKILDRTQVILDIFAQRARSRDGKLQVELAQLKYALPRLVEKDNALSRLTGGIGGRGPGETKLELGRRNTKDRINHLEKQIEQISKQRQVRRGRREQSAIPVVSIVGYTNAGKSTLLNSLTNAEVLAENKLFATLDPTSRRLRFPEHRELILTDTVGFIRDLPKDLINAFRATLEELQEADLLLHIIDASDPDWERKTSQVEAIIHDLKVSHIPKLLVFNKADRLPPEEAQLLAAQHSAICVSAIDAKTLPPLVARIKQLVFIPQANFKPWQADETELLEEPQTLLEAEPETLTESPSE